MTWGFAAQRRAEKFDQQVAGARTGPPGTPDDVHDDAQNSELLELVGALRALPEVSARPEFVADLRARLMAEAETALHPADVSRLQLPARHSRRERRIAALVGGLVIAGATTSVAVASQSALPGESLYPIKRAIESAQGGLAFGEASRGSRELASAANRLDEVSAMMAHPGVGTDEQVASTLDAFTAQATSGADLLIADYTHNGRESSIADLRDFASDSLDQLATFEPEIPYDARDELVTAARTLAQIDAEAAQQCPDCGGAPIAGIPPALLAAETIEVPAAPAAVRGPRTDPSRSPDPDGRPARGDEVELPEVGGTVPPGSVRQPGDDGGGAAPSPSAGPSPATNPLRPLTDALTGALTGERSPAPEGAGGSGGSGDASGGPVTEVVRGVGGILQGVLDPLTGAPASPSNPPRLLP